MLLGKLVKDPTALSRALLYRKAMIESIPSVKVEISEPSVPIGPKNRDVSVNRASVL